MAKSIKINFIYNVINTISGLLFPLITYPYVYRVLQADGVGLVNFYNSIISYIVLLTGLGIPLYGIREVARVRDCIKDLSKTTIEILLLNLLLNVIGYIIVFILCFSVDEIRADYPLFLLLSLSIILTSIGCTWFYAGIEDFKFIAIRSVLVKIVCAIFLFLTVKTKEDLYWYALYYVLVTTGNYLINFLYLKKNILLDKDVLAKLNIVKHIKPALSVFVFNLVTSIYLNLDKLMLGFLKDSTTVGYYTAATQLTHVFITVASALATVMLPRASNLIKLEKFDEFYRLSKKSYNIVLMITIPFVFGCMVMAPVLIHIFCGNGFEPSIMTLRIICPIIVALGVSNLIGMQMLYPLGYMKVVTFSTCIGATVNLLLNSILIPHYAQNGAAVATLFAEFSVTVVQILLAKKYIKFMFFSKHCIRYLVAAILMTTACYIVMTINMSEILLLFIVPIVGAFIYGLLLILYKDPLILEGLNLIKCKIL